MGIYSIQTQDFFLSCKECRIENPRSYYGCFCIGPFNSNQSLTVANSLRRTLLADLIGISITAVQINGASHEYSTLPGIRESVLDIMLNLKEIILKTDSFLEKPVFGYLYARGPGVVKACDLNLPPSIQCVDPNQYISTLSHDGILSMKYSIQRGQNFLVHESEASTDSLVFHFGTDKRVLNFSKKNKSTKTQFQNSQKQSDLSFFLEKSTLFLDAVFFPVNKVNYTIESYGPIDKINSNQMIVIEIWTNGSIHPRQALYEAINQLMNLFLNLEKMKMLNSIFSKAVFNSNKSYKTLYKKLETDYNYYNQSSKLLDISKMENDLFTEVESSSKTKTFQERAKKNQQNKNLTSLSILNLKLSKRSVNLLENANIKYISELLNYSALDLLKIRGFGRVCLREVESALSYLGLELVTH
jgi:DNA-directed RNA polymerase subunit alpha